MFSQISQNEAVIRVLNPTSKSVTIPASKVLATVCDIDTHSIQELNDSPSTNANMNVIDTSTNTKAQTDFDLKNADLTHDQKQRLRHFLQSNRDVFATNLSELGNSNLYKHKIETCNDARPVQRPFYHNAPHTEIEINRQVDEMLKHNIIKPSNSEYHSPVVLVKKKSGGMS